MMKIRAKHTPAPWYCVEYAGFMEIQAGEYYGDQKLLDLKYCNEAEENGLLASCAPDLLKACESALLELQIISCKCDPKVIDELERAINKALGL